LVSPDFIPSIVGSHCKLRGRRESCGVVVFAFDVKVLGLGGQRKHNEFLKI
jgi:hypothetical protein